jgi:hypothetical protein
LNENPQDGTLQGAQDVSRQPPATRDSPIPGPKKPSRQPAKNLTNSDPPQTSGKPSREPGSDIVQRPKSKQNPDKNRHVTTQTPESYQIGDVVSRADIQYVPSSTTVTRFIRGDLILPQTIDEAEIGQGLDIYDEMLLDPTIAGIRLWMNVNTLADGLTYEPADIEPEFGQEEPDPALLKEADWARRYVSAAVKRLKFTDRDIMLTLWDLLDGARIPHKLAEATYDTFPSGPYAGLPGLASLRTKPRRNYNLVYDTMNRFRGIVAIVPGSTLALWSGYIRDVSKLPGAVAAEKLVYFFADDRDGIPKSLYNAAFAPWARMIDLYADMMQTSGNSAGGKVSIVLGDKAAQQFTDPVTGATQTAEERAQAAASQWGNDGVLILMHGATPTVHYPQANALNTFIEGIKMCKNEIATALTTQAKAIFEGEHGSGLSEDTASEDAEAVITMLKSKLCIALDSLSYNLLKLAKGEEYAQRFCPKASMDKGDVADFPEAGQTWAAICAAEGFTPSQIPSISKMTGLKTPNAAELEILGATWLAQQKQKLSGYESQDAQNQMQQGQPNQPNQKQPPKKPKQTE